MQNRDRVGKVSGETMTLARSGPVQIALAGEGAMRAMLLIPRPTGGVCESVCLAAGELGAHRTRERL